MNSNIIKSNQKNGKVVTFYSFKGGVGRTMALVNIACIFAKKNKNVLVIDWDLDAPGLHTFFTDNIKNESIGLIEFIAKSIQYQNSNPQAEESDLFEFITNSIEPFICHNVLSSTPFNLDVIKAGKFDAGYSRKLESINWLSFYKSSPYFFKIFANVLEAKYDYIFIDSRTGLSDTGGICTMLMPQILVLVFALNNQNIKGVTDIAKQAIEYRFESNDDRNLNVLPLPSRIDDNQNAADLQSWIDNYRSKFETLFENIYLLDKCSLSAYFNKSKIPYKPEHAYGEKIPVLNESHQNDLFISYHYNQFADLLNNNIPCWKILSPEIINDNIYLANDVFKTALKEISLNNFSKAEQTIENAIEIIPFDYNTFLSWTDTLLSIAWTETGKKREFLYKSIFLLYSAIVELKPDSYEVYNNWGAALGDKAETKEGKEAEDLHMLAILKFKKAIEIKEDYFLAYYNWASSLRNLAQNKDKDYANELYIEALGKYNKVLEIEPKNSEAYNNIGTAFAELAQHKDEKEAEDLYVLAFEKYKKAIEIKPDYYLAYYNLATSLGNLARRKNKNEAEILYLQSFEKLQKAIEINPNSYEGYFNWATYLVRLAQLKKEDEATDLFTLAFPKYQKATIIKKDYHEAYCYWGSSLGKFAEIKEGEEAENLYFHAFEKFQKAIDIIPDYWEAYDSWGYFLGKLAQTKDGKEAEELYLQAFEKFQKAIDYGGTSYNLACLHANKKNEKEALHFLELCLLKKEQTINFIEQDEDWQPFQKNKQFIDILNKFR